METEKLLQKYIHDFLVIVHTQKPVEPVLDLNEIRKQH